MNLNEDQKNAVRRWIDEGLKLSEIQKRLASEFGAHITYMELRFLVDDLKVTPKDPEAAPAAAEQGDGRTAGPGPAGVEKERPAGGVPPGGGVSVSVDQITRPGAVISGKVTFSDGNSAEWYLDQMGRLGLAPRQEGYRPSQQDLMAFQTELQRELQRAGF